MKVAAQVAMGHVIVVLFQGCSGVTGDFTGGDNAATRFRLGPHSRLQMVQWHDLMNDISGITVS